MYNFKYYTIYVFLKRKNINGIIGTEIKIVNYNCLKYHIILVCKLY